MVIVKIYTTPTCPWCLKTKEWLKEHKIPFTNIDVSADIKAQREMIEKSGQMGVPVIDVGGKIIVGYDPAGIQQALKSVSAAKPKPKVQKKARKMKKSSKAKKRKL